MNSQLRRQRDRARKIIDILKAAYPRAACTLGFKTPHELLVATILSAQCTDVRVNAITRSLFDKYNNVGEFAGADINELENDIRPAGFFKNKAGAIKKSARMIESDFGGKVPDSMRDLIRLPGVGRKTASVILGAAFNKTEGIAVDTHVGRLSRRLGFSGAEDPNKIEKDLMTLIPEKDWIIISHLLIYHGRAVCHARKPRCNLCRIRKLCPSAA
jgi:endonuclease-3